MSICSKWRRLLLAVPLFLFFAAPATLSASIEDDEFVRPNRIDFGLPEDVKLMGLVRHLINPQLKAPKDLEALLLNPNRIQTADFSTARRVLDSKTIAQLAATSYRGQTLYYFELKRLMTELMNQTTYVERAYTELSDLVSDNDETNYPILTVDAKSWLESDGNNSTLATEITFRVFVLGVVGSGNQISIKTCSLQMEDTAIGRAPLGEDAVASFWASALRAMQGKLAVSYALNSALRPEKGDWTAKRPIIQANSAAGSNE